MASWVTQRKQGLPSPDPNVGSVIPPPHERCLIYWLNVDILYFIFFVCHSPFKGTDWIEVLVCQSCKHNANIFNLCSEFPWTQFLSTRINFIKQVLWFTWNWGYSVETSHSTDHQAGKKAVHASRWWHPGWLSKSTSALEMSPNHQHLA